MTRQESHPGFVHDQAEKLGDAGPLGAKARSEAGLAAQAANPKISHSLV